MDNGKWKMEFGKWKINATKNYLEPRILSSFVVMIYIERWSVILSRIMFLIKPKRKLFLENCGQAFPY